MSDSTKSPEAVHADLIHAFSRLTRDTAPVRTFRGILRHIRDAGHELETLIEDYKGLPTLDPAEFREIDRAFLLFTNRLIAWHGDREMDGFAPPTSPDEESDILGIEDRLRPRTQLDITYTLIILLRLRCILWLLDNLPTDELQRAALCKHYASACHDAPELLLLLSADDRARVASLDPIRPTQLSVDSGSGTVYQFLIADAVGSHQQYINAYVMRGLMSGDAREFDLAHELIDDVRWFISDNTVGPRFTQDFTSLHQPVNLITLLATALLRWRISLTRHTETLISVVAEDDGEMEAFVFAMPSADEISRLPSSERMIEYFTNPLVFTMLYSHERAESHVIHALNVLEERITTLRRASTTVAIFRDAANSPASHATAVGLITWGLVPLFAPVDPSGAIVAAVVDFVIGTLFRSR